MKESRRSLVDVIILSSLCVDFDRDMTRPVSLQKERLEDRLREHRVLQSDIDSHHASVESVSRTAQDLINNASNPRLAKKIETKTRDLVSR